jgi:hypothetical protein
MKSCPGCSRNRPPGWRAPLAVHMMPRYTSMSGRHQLCDDRSGTKVMRTIHAARRACKTMQEVHQRTPQGRHQLATTLPRVCRRGGPGYDGARATTEAAPALRAGQMGWQARAADPRAAAVIRRAPGGSLRRRSAPSQTRASHLVWSSLIVGMAWRWGGNRSCNRGHRQSARAGTICALTGPRGAVWRG